MAPEQLQRSINFVLGGEGGLLRVSPWLILHQLGEAFIVYSDEGGRFWELGQLAQQWFGPHWFVELFKMGSAREARAAGTNQVADPWQELLVEYLWHGRHIRRNYGTYDRALVDQFVTAVEQELDTMLRDYTGQIVTSGFQ